MITERVVTPATIEMDKLLLIEQKKTEAIDAKIMKKLEKKKQEKEFGW